MTRTEKRKERERKRAEVIVNALVGFCAAIGGLYVFCCCVSLILRMLGVN